MLIGVVGERYSGKQTLINYLVNEHYFKELKITKKHASCTSNSHEFPSFADAIQYATSHWKEKFIIKNIQKYHDFEVAMKRPFFVLLAVTAPTTIRFKRLRNLVHENMDDDITLTDLSLESKTDALPKWSSPNLTLEQFLQLDEHDLYHQRHYPHSHHLNLVSFIKNASISILNDGSDLMGLKKQIQAADLENPEHTRPSWDSYFMALCELASKRSNCMKRRVGCIVVQDSRVVSTGYNGTPRNVKNCNQGGCPRCNNNASCGSNLDHCICLHAEENALLEAGRERLSSGNTVLYCNTCPCLGCSKKIIQVGISEVVYAQDYGMDSMTKALLKEAGVKLRQISPINVMMR